MGTKKMILRMILINTGNILYNMKNSYLSIFIVILSFLSLKPFSITETHGRCIIRYDINEKIKSIETLDDGIAYCFFNERNLKILSNSLVTFSDNSIDLVKGTILFKNDKIMNDSINTKLFLSNEWSKCQFFRIELPNSAYNTQSAVKINYTLPDKSFDISAKLNFLAETGNNTSYYGFFIPYHPSWKVKNIKLTIEIYDQLINNAEIIPLFIFKNEYEVKSKVFEKQKILFQPSKSNQMVNMDVKQYNDEKKIRDGIYLENNSSFYFSSGFSLPLNDLNEITSEIGLVREWILSNKKIYMVDIHTGLDIAKAKNTEVKASSDGIIRYGAYCLSLGNAVIIDHGFSLFSTYMHLNKILVKPGDKVKKGDVIGLVGMTGAATGPHLHWETRVYNIAVDPRSFLNIEDIFVQ
jgi:murein DD-endopeptidase MepM/ murein hydrolase activator NlpD